MAVNASLGLAASHGRGWQRGNEEEGEARIRFNRGRTPLSSRSPEGILPTCVCRLNIRCIISHTI